MNIGRIRFINEILIEQMNHWLLYPLALVVAGASLELTGEGEPALLMWTLCSLFPLVFFLIRCAVRKLIPFTLLHLGVAALSLLIPVPFPLGRVVCMVCAAGYLISSHVLRLKYDVLFSEAIHLPVGVGLGAFSIFFIHYLEIRDWENCYIFPLIGGIVLYFISYYIERYLNFLSVNESSAGFLPAKEMFRSGLGLVVLYSMLGGAILMLSSQFAWLAGILQPIKNLLIAFLRFLFSGHTTSEEEAEIPLVEEQPTNNMGEMKLPEAEEPFWLWKVLEYLFIIALICAICAGMAVLLVKLVRLIIQYMNLHRMGSRDVESEDAWDFREKCGLERNKEKKRQSLFEALSPRERIRRLYKKKLLSSVSSDTDRSSMKLYTAREWEEKLRTDGMAKLYGLARYSDREITGAEVKKMKEVCK